MSTLELVLNMLAEATTTEISKEKIFNHFLKIEVLQKRAAKLPEMHERILKKAQENLILLQKMLLTFQTLFPM